MGVMPIMIRLSTVLALTLLCASPGRACDEFKPVDLETGQKLMGILEAPNAQALDKIFAFQTLACADQPIMRRFATDEGIKSKNPLLRAQALAEIVLQRDAIKIELTETPGLPDSLRNWLKAEGHSLVYRVSRPQGRFNCVGINGANCDDLRQYQFRVDGEKVRLFYGNIVGDFQLAEGRNLRGTIKNGANPAVPAKIDLE